MKSPSIASVTGTSGHQSKVGLGNKNAERQTTVIELGWLNY